MKSITGNGQQHLEQCANLLRDIDISQKYNSKSPQLINFYQNIPETQLSDFNKALLNYLIDSFDSDSVSIKIPPSMTDLYDNEFIRIKHLISNNNEFNFSWDNDLFVKDLAICSGRLLPIGPGLLEVSGVPRKMLFTAGWQQFLSLAYCWLKLDAIRPLFEIHTHLANVSNFTQQGWSDAYLVVADLLESNPSIQGFMRSSWFIDPKITEISPRLSYLRQVPQSYGASIFYYGDEGRNSGSFSRSKSRLALYDKGLYIPKTYYLVWPRQFLFEYRSSNSNNAGGENQ